MDAQESPPSIMRPPKRNGFTCFPIGTQVLLDKSLLYGLVAALFPVAPMGRKITNLTRADIDLGAI